MLVSERFVLLIILLHRILKPLLLDAQGLLGDVLHAAYLFIRHEHVPEFRALLRGHSSRAVRSVRTRAGSVNQVQDCQRTSHVLRLSKKP